MVQPVCRRQPKCLNDRVAMDALGDRAPRKCGRYAVREWPTFVKKRCRWTKQTVVVQSHHHGNAHALGQPDRQWPNSIMKVVDVDNVGFKLSNSFCQRADCPEIPRRKG